MKPSEGWDDQRRAHRKEREEAERIQRLTNLEKLEKKNPAKERRSGRRAGRDTKYLASPKSREERLEIGMISSHICFVFLREVKQDKDWNVSLGLDLASRRLLLILAE